jgi:Skp family chaperone for outer membrane proteins
VSVPALLRPDGAEDESAAVAKEISQLEVSLLEDEVKLIRSQVSDALKAKVQYETSISTVDPKAWEEAESAYLKARDVLLKKSRELASAKRRVGNVEEAKGDDKRSGDAASGKEHAAGAMVGSINMDAVWERYGKVRQIQERMDADRADAKEQLAKLQSDIKAMALRIGRPEPGGADDRAPEDQLKALKRKYEVQSDLFERDLTQRQARESAGVLEDVQEAIAAIAKAKGMDYVVKFSPAPQLDATPNDVHTAFNRSVLYANPRNDITEEVIRELNRRFESAGHKVPR